jgi:D-sedoheptulose 7-phosphate isomerase
MMLSTSVLAGRFAADALAYLQRLQGCFSPEVLTAVETLAQDLLAAWSDGRNVYICGNGGSAANAMHMANDFHYGIGACGPGPRLPGLRVEALPANAGIITCLANDTGYDNIYAHQLQVKGRRDDLLIVLSGSGNSANVVRAVETAQQLGMKTFAVLAFSGGRCRELADVPIHFKIDDMQIAEDTQLVVGHLCMQWLNSHKPATLAELP